MRDEDCILHKKTLLLVLGLGLVVLSANCGVVAQDKKKQSDPSSSSKGLRWR
jgi:hypothetical protein